MSKTMYLVTPHTNAVKAVTIEVETEKTVTINRDGRKSRHKKSSVYENFFDTFEEAKAFMVNERKKSVHECQVLMDKAKRNLAIAEGCRGAVVL